MAHRFPRAFAFVLAPLVAAACGSSAPTGNLDHVQVTLSQFEVTLTNTSGHLLDEVVVAIDPVGPGTPFTARPERIQSGETRHWDHSAFLDGDSVPFSPRNKKASRVTVTAKDQDGKPLKVQVPFKM